MRDIYDLPRSIHVNFEETKWRDKAGCKNMDISLFFPERTKLISQVAKDTCASCPVQQECLDYAIKMAIREGFWGGKSVRQRRDIRRLYVMSQQEEQEEQDE